ncbi:hypothetical protein PF005_g17495 [Phytophthora fragariae]|uniref:non-specific serine/threonine protein kinase n=1 Tax=Phytophthora fragariae TaxID=53985 RepID=A0A6A3JMW3_9STRA|nr:hypothetical protein PF003_g23137 [Phytophthora fragariae]KAE8943429.1 hypothetical protein PF009_g6844 [Phytophthora fragariae]KAE8994778.1 hypothetical protein PF011_g16599 [Phytophthora fragariae]KAE9094542.1 hypothetical protein PF010_g17057 [Phytophthora fragariae]KAE9128336.1 hypothetical protein PF007_g5305 [Phytophthora fragariae]
MHAWTLALCALALLDAALAANSTSSSATSGTLNTLTTSCNGGCSSNGACVVVGQSSANAIDCVSDTSCVTLSSGQSALCLDAFSSTATEWVFQPAESNDTEGAGPFERVGLLQLDDHITDLTFKKAEQGEEPLSGSLELSSMNVQPDATLDKVTFKNLSLSGLDSALPLNSVKRIYFNNCSLSEIPTAAVAGDSVTVIDLSGNAIAQVDTDFQDETFTNLTLLDLSSNALTGFSLVADNFPAITTLYLHDNSLQTIPEVIFNMSTLQFLTLVDNPIDASGLTAAQFTFLAKLELFTIDGITNTSACPTTAVQTKLNGSFTFCAGKNNDVGSSNTTVTEQPATTMPATTEGDSSSSSSHKTWIILGACLGAVVLLAILGLIWWCCRRRRNEQPKLMNSTTPSIAIGMGDLSDHPYMELGVPGSNASSQTTSDFELLASVADGYIGLTRLSYDDVFLHKMLRVSSRSELWLGEFKHEAVLVKKIKSNTASKALMRDFVTEIELMFELKHPRIAAFRGAMWDADGTELCAVVEYVEKGALRDCTVNNAVELSVPKQHAIARQISEAMAFLHKQNIVHGRLNAFNILLDKDYSAKLSIFSIFHYVKLSPLDNECKAFVAPEVLRGEQPTERSDVYAFGVVLVEIDTGETPVMNARKLSMERSGREDDLSPTAKMTGFRLSRLCSGVMKETIAACLDKNPARRPSMADVALAFKNGAMKL